MRSRRDIELGYVEKISDLLDRKYTIPGSNIRFGFDPIIGLIPFLGHAVSFVISAGLIAIMIRHGASGKVAAKMTLNALIDAVIGAIPVAGNIFDFFFKANSRNVRLLKAHYAKGKHQGTAMDILAPVAIALLIAAVLLTALCIWAVVALTSLIFWGISIYAGLRACSWSIRSR